MPTPLSAASPRSSAWLFASSDEYAEYLAQQGNPDQTITYTYGQKELFVPVAWAYL